MGCAGVVFARAELSGALEDDPEYKLIVASNKLMTEIDDEIGAVHKYTMDIYSKKFPSLESIVTDIMDYFKVVKAIGNEMVRGVVATARRAGRG